MGAPFIVLFSVFVWFLQEIAKLLDGQSGVPNDTAEGKGVHRV